MSHVAAETSLQLHQVKPLTQRLQSCHPFLILSNNIDIDTTGMHVSSVG